MTPWLMYHACVLGGAYIVLWLLWRERARWRHELRSSHGAFHANKCMCTVTVALSVCALHPALCTALQAPAAACARGPHDARMHACMMIRAVRI